MLCRMLVARTRHADRLGDVDSEESRWQELALGSKCRSHPWLGIVIVDNAIQNKVQNDKYIQQAGLPESHLLQY